MTNLWELLALLAFGLCPASALIGLLVGILAMREMGVKWPWEREQANGLPPNNHRRAFRRDYKTIRVQAKHMIDRVYAEESKGWIYAGVKESTVGVYDVTFFREV